jgi:hypothetical protein
MEIIKYGRRKYTFLEGKLKPAGLSITERSLRGENEKEFTSRLMKSYGKKQGTIEVILKNGFPDYAVITFE